jgi:ABC-type Fe3+/spermidine/putrescine transport system ATPase subunit
VHALVRPETVAAVPDPAGSGEVIERTFLGASMRMSVQLDDGQLVLVEAPSHADAASVGQRVGLRILGESVTVAAA